MYYVTATELKKDKKGNPIEVIGRHAILAKSDLHLSERCDKLFVRWSDKSEPFPLSKEWDCFYFKEDNEH